jgi:hypothetical protein
MEANPWLAVTNGQALRFFFEHLRDVSEPDDAPESEVLYNASVLAHFASTSTATREFPGTPTSLCAVFDLFVMDRSQQADPGIMEAAGSQCLLLTGFFGPQLAARYNIEWYASLGAGFYGQAASREPDRARAAMMRTMAARFPFWRRQHSRLARELSDMPRMLRRAG